MAHVGAGVPANTGEAGANDRVTLFAGTPAPTKPRKTMNFAGTSGLSGSQQMRLDILAPLAQR